MSACSPHPPCLMMMAGSQWSRSNFTFSQLLWLRNSVCPDMRPSLHFTGRLYFAEEHVMCWRYRKGRLVARLTLMVESIRLQCAGTDVHNPLQHVSIWHMKQFLFTCFSLEGQVLTVTVVIRDPTGPLPVTQWIKKKKKSMVRMWKITSGSQSDPSPLFFFFFWKEPTVVQTCIELTM